MSVRSSAEVMLVAIAYHYARVYLPVSCHSASIQLYLVTVCENLYQVI